MKIDILSLFPDYFRGPFDESIVKRARQQGLVEIRLINIRDYTEDKHRRVDDRPYGGGPGMVLTPQPVVSAVRDMKSRAIKVAGESEDLSQGVSQDQGQNQSRVIYLSPQGTPLTAAKCQELAQQEHLILLCGHYEGIDQRALDLVVDEEISIGDYVLTNGCLPAIVLVDAVVRFIPGVLGHTSAAAEDSFQNGILDCPHYTRPVEFEGMSIPAVLAQGHHEEIRKWRYSQALEKTRLKRPDLYTPLS